MGVLILYRQSRDFPPSLESYVTAAERRKTPFRTELEQKASQGLSAFTDIGVVRDHARRNPRLGSIIVRYHMDDDIVHVEHLLGHKCHVTVFMHPPSKLADYLDYEWWENIT